LDNIFWLNFLRFSNTTLLSHEDWVSHLENKEFSLENLWSWYICTFTYPWVMSIIVLTIFVEQRFHLL
jgi:hypothetical protein